MAGAIAGTAILKIEKNKTQNNEKRKKIKVSNTYNQ